MNKRAEVEGRAIQQAIAAFADHQLIDQEERRWAIARLHEDGGPCSAYFTEVIAIRAGLFVGGDIDDVVFRYGPSPVCERIAWIGACTDMRYVQQKAQLGLTDDGLLTKDYDADVAADDIRGHMADADANDLCVFEDALGLVGNREEMVANMVDGLDDSWEWVGGIGSIVSMRTIMAWAAVRRLHELLGGWEK